MMTLKHERGFSLVGLLITLVCMVILMSIGLNAMNKAVTGEGSATKNSVRSMDDKLTLYALYQSMAVHALDNDGAFVVPSELTHEGDMTVDTTASLFSAMVMANYISVEKLVSANEYSHYVQADDNYNYLLHNPAADVYWDPDFVADLDTKSNVSYAHMPLYGERFDQYWGTEYSSNFPLIGNRGPIDGIEDPDSYSYGRSGVWGGHIVFGDGHIDFFQTFTPPNVFFERGGQRFADNIFAVDDGIDGADAILSFTKSMTEDGPELQFD